MDKFLVIKSILGESIFEELNKNLIKLKTNAKIDLKDLHSAIETVPKSIVAFVIRETTDLPDEETKEVQIPWDDKAVLNFTKRAADAYDGYIKRDGHITHEFHALTIPMIAAHIMSEFELYDLEESSESSKSESSSSESSSSEGSFSVSESTSEGKDPSLKLEDRIKSLEAKIDAIISFVAQGNKVSMTKEEFIDEHEKLIDVLKNPSKEKLKDEAEEQEKELEDVKKSEQKTKLIKSLARLKKAGLAPKMPSPPRPGTKVGGTQGISQKGLLSDKTSHTDLRTKPTTQMENPYLKAKDIAKKSERIVVKSSDLNSNCVDCGKPVSKCLCFAVLSKPEMKQIGDKTTLKFNSDWDKEAVLALYKSIQRAKNVRR